MPWETGDLHLPQRCLQRGPNEAYFDTNHHLIVVWDPTDLASGADALKTTIRVTLPAEAKLAD